nr:pyruvate, water dikinase regulatory protein [Thermicanus aegyptius]
MSTDHDRKFYLYVLSDSVGETAEFVARAAASQFDGHGIEIRRISFIDDESTVDEVIASAKENEAVVVYTIVVPRLKEHLIRVARREKVPVVDIMGPIISRLSKKMRIPPKYKPGLVHQLDEDYFKKVEAIEFAVKYDDGKDPRGILRSDVVLIGVSRTSKTPLSMYLAHKRLKVANVPLVPEVPPPEELFMIPPKKCIGLTINPEHLNNIRTERLKSLGLTAQANYASLERILYELEYAEKIMKRIGCPVINVTNKAVEETANIILEVIKGGRI